MGNTGQDNTMAEGMGIGHAGQCGGSARFATQAEAQQSIDDMTVVKHWNPSRSSAAIGVVCSLVFPAVIMLLAASLFAVVFGAGPNAQGAGLFVGAIVETILVILYASVFYPSYFTSNPMLRRSDDVSFANCFMGGIVFGLLWNENIRTSMLVKRPEKGASYIVAIVLGGIVVTNFMLSFAFGMIGEVLMW